MTEVVGYVSLLTNIVDDGESSFCCRVDSSLAVLFFVRFLFRVQWCYRDEMDAMETSLQTVEMKEKQKKTKNIKKE